MKDMNKVFNCNILQLFDSNFSKNKNLINKPTVQFSLEI